MEGEFNFALLGLLLGGAALVALLVSDDDDDNSNDEAGNPGTPGEDGVPTITPSNPEGDNTVSSGDTFDLTESQRFAMGAGDDTVFAGDGDDTLLGGSGNDSLDGSTGNDTVFGGSGDDITRGGFGDDEIFMGIGEDKNISDSLLSSINGTFNGSTSIADANTALANLKDSQNVDRLFKEMGGDDNILGGASRTEADDAADADDNPNNDTVKDGDDTIFDLIGENSISGSVGNDVIATFDRDGTSANIFNGTPSGDVVFGGFGADIIWADNGDEVTLDPLAESANKSEDTLYLAEALADRGPNQEIGDGDTLDGNDFVTVNDFDTEEDKLVLVSATVQPDDLSFAAYDGGVQLVADGDVLARFVGGAVEDFADVTVEIQNQV